MNNQHTDTKIASISHIPTGKVMSIYIDSRWPEKRFALSKGSVGEITLAAAEKAIEKAKASAEYDVVLF